MMRMFNSISLSTSDKSGREILFAAAEGML